MRGEVWKIAIDALRANKVKALLTMLGVVIGSACIVLVVTISLIGKSYIIAQIEGVGSNIVYGELRRTGIQNTTFGDEITLSDLEAIHDTVPDVERVAGTHDALYVDRKSTRLNSSHTVISYAVFCLKKKTE